MCLQSAATLGDEMGVRALVRVLADFVVEEGIARANEGEALVVKETCFSLLCRQVARRRVDSGGFSEEAQDIFDGDLFCGLCSTSSRGGWRRGTSRRTVMKGECRDDYVTLGQCRGRMGAFLWGRKREK